jgi:pimeloyl-ACP methyl ester carboxylesterase
MALKSIVYKEHSFDISYEIVNPTQTVDIVILHGWGSNKNLMKQSFSQEMSAFRHIYIDLPGFGNSTAPMAMTTADVAEIISLLLRELSVSKDIIVGHSFGGKVATLLEPEMLVLIASAGIVWSKPLKIRAKILFTKLLNGVGLKKFRSAFVAEDAKELSRFMYETFKNVVDEDFSSHFISYKNEALLFWGKEDSATPLRSAKKIASLLPKNKLFLYDGDHYFFMKESSDIAKKIQEQYLEKMKD